MVSVRAFIFHVSPVRGKNLVAMSVLGPWKEIGKAENQTRD